MKRAENPSFSSKQRSGRKVKLLKTSPRRALGNVSNVIAEESLMGSDVTDSLIESPSRALRRQCNPLPPPVIASPSKFKHRIYVNVSFTYVLIIQ